MDTQQDIGEEEDVALRKPRRKRRTARLNVNLTSLIDVTFLLLIYFMVATNISRGEEAYLMDLPRRVGRSADPFELPRQPIRIMVQTTGPAANAYQVQVEGSPQQPTSFDSLHDLLRGNQINDANPAGLFEADTPVVIIPGPETRWEHAIDAFNAAARARYTNITFARPG